MKVKTAFSWSVRLRTMWSESWLTSSTAAGAAKDSVSPVSEEVDEAAGEESDEEMMMEKRIMKA